MGMHEIRYIDRMFVFSEDGTFGAERAALDGDGKSKSERRLASPSGARGTLTVTGWFRSIDAARALYL